MRTKTLVCAAVMAAGLASSAMAQSNVFSLNIVGYVNFTQPASKYDIICNPLNQTNNDVSFLFPNAASYPGLSVFVRSGAGYLNAFYDPDSGGWTGDYPLAIAPGTGFWLQTPAGLTYSNTFVGEVVLDSTNSIPSGYSLKSSVVPQTTSLVQMGGFPLGQANGATGNVGDSVYFYNGTAYDTFTYDPDSGGWNNNGNPQEPAASKVTQGFWAQNQGSSTTWIRHFTVQ
jgi:hypothetical protein